MIYRHRGIGEFRCGCRGLWRSVVTVPREVPSIPNSHSCLAFLGWLDFCTMTTTIAADWSFVENTGRIQIWGFFLENNNKTQTISLVRKRFKLFWFLAIQVKRARFLIFYFIICQQLSWFSKKRRQKSSPMDSFSMHRKRVLWTRFLSIETESIGLDFCLRGHSTNSAAGK